MTVPFDKYLVEDLAAAVGPRLRVVEAHLEDVEQGVVRTSEATMAALGVQPGGAVLIEGERNTMARLLPLQEESGQRLIIQMDGLIRENTGISLDDRIRITPCDPPYAQTLLITPLEKASYGPAEVRRIREVLAGRILTLGDKVMVPLHSRKGTQFQVAAFEPEGAGCIAVLHTDVRIQEQVRTSLEIKSSVKYEDIGGLQEELTRIREMIELPMKYPELLAQLRIEPPKGVLLYGPPGTGKTTIARAIASEVNAHFIRINGPEVIHKFYGESEAKLREIFEEAQRRAPSIIFIDEIDAIAPKRTEVAGEVEKRVVAQLLALMDGMVSRGEVVIIGATNVPELLDHALRRPGRFDREVVVKVPNRPGRLQILKIHSRGMPLADDVDMERLAEITHGFVGADLEVLCKEAGMSALKDVLEREDFAEKEISELAGETSISMHHFFDAFKGIEPTATREFFAERPNVKWEEVGGLHAGKALLRSTVELPRLYPNLSKAAGATAPRGIMLSGPPGSGKTLLVRALATEGGFSFITVDAAALFSKWVGESEKALRQVFIKGKQASPCILFFDELDTIFPRRGQSHDAGGRERLIGQFLSEMDGLEKFSEVVVIGATNRLDLVEPALLNPSRFGIVIELELPDEQERLEILAIHTADMKLDADVRLEELARRTEGMSGADLTTLCRRTGFERLQSYIAAHGDKVERMIEQFTVRMEDFSHALTAASALQSRNSGSAPQ
ncbi:MAG: AAA family ATPase [SAR324 cluster bacterium]|nr:AAA family ATPase [SAR324 cluster bacterium]